MYHKVLNAHRMVDRRKDLRRRSTECEKLLWLELRNSKLGYRFKRQYSIMNFVVDFYCPKVKLAIEVDGDIHKKVMSQKYDQYRTRYLSSLGVREIRFINERLKCDMNYVVADIISHLPSPEVRRGNEGEV